ncbi:transporter substrate-binding domain-containing protein [Kiloniella sp.]|uniref:transporter substrate-binding domain-containing protein n=1 Tax=Kiloniella sp. TaxID=1938587 RepID=UPI003B01E349
MQQSAKFSLVKVLFVVWACLAPLTARAEEQFLRILAVHWPPYEFETPVNGLRGYDVEVVDEVFRRMGLKVKVEFMPWTRAVALVFTGQAMALLSCGKKKDRDAHLYYSDTLSVSSEGYFMRKEDTGPKFESLVELRGQRITAVRGYVTQKDLVTLGIKHITVNTDESALKALINKRVDIYYASKENNEFIAKQLGFSDKLEFQLFRQITDHLCFSKKWPGSKDMLARFNIGLSELKADGTYKKIHDKYR